MDSNQRKHCDGFTERPPLYGIVSPAGSSSVGFSEVLGAAMTSYAQVQHILSTAVGGVDVPVPGPHGAFWRTRTRDQFVQFSIFGLPVVTPGTGTLRAGYWKPRRLVPADAGGSPTGAG
jgi:hypothetical protein